MFVYLFVLNLCSLWVELVHVYVCMLVYARATCATACICAVAVKTLYAIVNI